MVKLRHKRYGHIAWSGQFNVASLSEIIVTYEDGSADSAFRKDWDAFVGGQWKDLRQAFRDHDLVTDNYNTRFFEPSCGEDRERGFTL